MNLTRAFFTVSGLTFVSRALGLVREMMIAALLGAGAVADAFFVAFRLPNLFRRFFAEGAFNMAFVPLFSKKLEGPGEERGGERGRGDGKAVSRAALRDAEGFAQDAFAGLLSVLFVLTLVAMLTMPWLLLALAYGFRSEPDKYALAVAFSQVQFPYLLFISLTALASGVLNSFGKFAAAAAAPVLLNVTMIAALTAAWALGGDDATVGWFLTLSVLIAGVLQFVFVAAAARRAGIRLRLSTPRWTPDMRRLVRLGIPGALAGGVTQINILIGTTVASFFAGAVTMLTLADRLYQLPLGMVGVAIGVALLPALSRCIQAEDYDGVDHTFSRAWEVSALFTLPATIALLVIPEEIVRMLFGRGAFTEENVVLTGQAVALYATGLPAYILIKVLSPCFFAEEDTKTPLQCAVVSMVVNTVLSIALIPVLSWFAIPVATSVAAWVNVALLWREIGDRGLAVLDRQAKLRTLMMFLASLAMGGVLLALARFGTAWTQDPTLMAPSVLALCVVGAGIYGVVAMALGALRLRELRAALRRAEA